MERAAKGIGVDVWSSACLWVSPVVAGRPSNLPDTPVLPRTHERLSILADGGREYFSNRNANRRREEKR